MDSTCSSGVSAAHTGPAARVGHNHHVRPGPWPLVSIHTGSAVWVGHIRPTRPDPLLLAAASYTWPAGRVGHSHHSRSGLCGCRGCCCCKRLGKQGRRSRHQQHHHHHHHHQQQPPSAPRSKSRPLRADLHRTCRGSAGAGGQANAPALPWPLVAAGIGSAVLLLALAVATQHETAHGPPGAMAGPDMASAGAGIASYLCRLQGAPWQQRQRASK